MIDDAATRDLFQALQAESKTPKSETGRRLSLVLAALGDRPTDEEAAVAETYLASLSESIASTPSDLPAFVGSCAVAACMMYMKGMDNRKTLYFAELCSENCSAVGETVQITSLRVLSTLYANMKMYGLCIEVCGQLDEVLSRQTEGRHRSMLVDTLYTMIVCRVLGNEKGWAQEGAGVLNRMKMLAETEEDRKKVEKV